MQEKNLLINSMQKLINHIVVSRKNQEEIFASLTKNDFQKIISNLQDQNHMLRKTSLILITQLLYNNTALKEVFCKIVSIPIFHGRVPVYVIAKIVFNAKFIASNGKTGNNDITMHVKMIYSLVKQPIHEAEKNCLFWFINHSASNYPPKAEFMNNIKIQKSTISQFLDPLECMIGFIMPNKNVPKNVQTSSAATMLSSMVQSIRKGRSQYEPVSSGPNRLLNNYFRPRQAQTDEQKVDPIKVNSSFNSSTIGPGYSIDRQMHYIPKTTIPFFKSNNNPQVYRDHKNSYTQNMTTSMKSSLEMQMQKSTNQTLQLKSTGVYDHLNRMKHGGITIVSSSNSNNNSTTKNVNRDLQGKYFDENPIFHVQTTTNQSKYPTQGAINQVRAVSGYKPGVAMSGGKVIERGYETLREKKMIEKYPY